MSIVPLLLDLMPDTIIVTPGVTDAFGDFVASGEVLSLPCHMQSGTRQVFDLAGREVVSSLQAVIGGYNNLTESLHRFTIPSRFTPNTDLVALRIYRYSDDDGPSHEAVLFP